MKELKSKIVDFRAKPRKKAAFQSISLDNNSLVILRREPKPRKINPIKPLQPQNVEVEQSQPFKNRSEQLAAKAQQINLLASELETAMFQLKAIANQIDCQRQTEYDIPKPPEKTCEFVAAIVPDVKCDRGSGFVLTTRCVDLFRAEREATEVARSLRQQANKKQLKSQLSNYKRRLLGWLF